MDRGRLVVGLDDGEVELAAPERLEVVDRSGRRLRGAVEAVLAGRLVDEFADRRADRIVDAAGHAGADRQEHPVGAGKRDRVRLSERDDQGEAPMHQSAEGRRAGHVPSSHFMTLPYMVR